MTTTWLDFRELRQRLDFAQVLKHYGVELKLKRSGQHQGFCPLPTHQGHRRSPSFSVNLDRRIWKCFGCGSSGNVLDFVSRMEGVDPDDGRELRRIALLTAERFGLGEGKPPPAAKPIEKVKALTESAQKNAERAATRSAIVNAPLDFELKALDFEHPYLKERGFTAETIAHFGLGYCSRGLMQGRIVIPLHDAAGRLLGYAGRVVDDSAISEDTPKYRFPGSRERQGTVYEFHKSFFLYNGFAAGAARDMVIVEGFASVWWLWQHGYPNVVALMGCDCSEAQAKLIVQAVPPDGTVWLMPDGDPAGERCAESALKLVSPHRRVRWLRLDPDRQPTDSTTESLRTLLQPIQAGEGGSDGRV